MKDPLGLREYLVEELQSPNMTDEQTKHFMGTPATLPTRQTFIFESLKDLKAEPET